MLGGRGRRSGGRFWGSHGAGSTFALGLLALLLTACASGREVITPGPYPPDVEPVPAEAAPPSVYIIHGDADYLYHDADGNRLQADEEALRQAREAARAARGDVYIFHQRTGLMRRFWGSRGGVFEHYRAGRRLARETYVRRDGSFADEADLLRQRTAKHAGPTLSGAPARLAYFGHEIPPGRTGRDDPNDSGAEEDSEGLLTIPEFARGLRALAAALRAAPDAANEGVATTAGGRGEHDTVKPYALVVLSTCYGGNPAMMRALAPLAEFAVASPAYLHLSYLDARPLATTRFTGGADGGAASLRREETRAVAESVARASFDRLRETTLTEVTVAVYDLKETMPPLPVAPARITDAEGARRWRDCAADESLSLGEESTCGITLRYRPPRFGAGKNTAARSAWQCPL